MFTVAMPNTSEKEMALMRLQEMNTQIESMEKSSCRAKEGQLSARERVIALLDGGTFQELDRFVTHRCHRFGMEKKKPLGDGVVTGHGKIGGRAVCVYSQDFSVFGGSLSGAHAAKICKLLDLAVKMGVPLLGLNDSGGARIQEGVEALGGYAEIFWRNVQASGVIPQISLILGPCAGGAVYSPAITDFIIMNRESSFMFVTGPDVIKEVTHETTSKEELGGVSAHAVKSGICSLVSNNETHSFTQLRKLLSYIPSNNRELPPRLKEAESGDKDTGSILSILPEDSKQSYDCKKVIEKIVDEDSCLWLHDEFALNIITGFGRIAGDVVGIVANQPLHLAGCLDINASRKAARFVRFCDSFNIPLLTIVDVPGFLPGTDQEHNGIIIHGAKLLYAYCEASVPKITLITRQAYGGAYDVMASKHIRADFNFAYPQAKIAVMGPEGAIKILYKNKIKENPGIVGELTEKYKKTFSNPYMAASYGYIDEVIEPKDTRRKIANALELTRNKKESRPHRKHGNIPL